jgi:hypothetical protein
MPTTEEQRCPRCFIGIDDDGDGDCATCAALTDLQAMRIRARIRAILTELLKHLGVGA